MAGAEQGVGSEPPTVVVSPDGRWVALGDAAGRLHLREVRASHLGLAAVTPATPGFPVAVHDAAIRSVAAGVLPDERTVLATAAADGSVAVVAAADGAVIARLADAHGDGMPVTAVALAGSAGQAWLVTAGADAKVRVRSWPELAHVHTVPHDAPVTALAVTDALDGHGCLVVSGDTGGTVALWRLDASAPPQPQQRSAPASVTAAAAAMVDGGLLAATGGDDGSVTYWRVTASAPGLTIDPARHLSPIRDAVRAVGVVADGPRSLVVACGAADDVWFWRIDDGSRLRLPRPEGGHALAVGRHAPTAPLAAAPGWVVALATPDGGVELVTSRDLPRAAGRPDAWGVSDAPIDDDRDDRLGFGHYADALAYMIDHPRTSTPLTIAIDAPWGAGKTSLGRMIEARLSPPGHHPAKTNREFVSHISCWFDAWLYDEQERLASALAATVVRELDPERSWWSRLVRPVPGGLLSRQARLRRALVFVVAPAIGLGAVTTGLGWSVRPDLIPLVAGLVGVEDEAGSRVVFGVSVSVLAGLAAQVAGWLGRFRDAIAGYVDSPSETARTGSTLSVQRQLARFVRDATRRRDLRRPRRLVLFIDNLERCKPPRALDVCEVVSQLFGLEDVVVVMMVDMRSIAASAEVGYEPLAQRLYPATAGAGYGQDFLDKIVQFQFTLPTHAAPTIGQLFRHSVSAEGRGDGAPPPTRAAPGDRLAHLARSSVLAPRRAYRAVVAGLARLARRRGLRRRSRDAAPPRATRPSGTPSGGSVPHLVLPTVAAVVVATGLGTGDGAGSVGWTVAMVIGVMAAFGYAEFRNLRRRVEEQRLEHQERLLTKYFGDDLRAQSSVAAAAQGLEDRLRGLGVSVDHTLLRSHVRQALVDDSVAREEAEQEAVRWLPPVPRHAKRLANRLLVTLAIAFERQLLGGASPVTARHLGKWVAFAERWPRLARQVSEDPGLLCRLEQALEVPPPPTGVPILDRREPAGEPADPFGRLLAAHGLVPADAADLRAMLGEPPALSDVADVLTRCALPATPEPPAPAGHHAAQRPPGPVRR